MNTCDTCKNYTMPVVTMPNAGDCKLISEYKRSPNGIDRISSDAEYNYESWCYVGLKFGCIHWIAKEEK